jgi:hypothetical protein
LNDCEAHVQVTVFPSKTFTIRSGSWKRVYDTYYWDLSGYTHMELGFRAIPFLYYRSLIDRCPSIAWFSRKSTGVDIIALLHIIARPHKFLTRSDFEFFSMAMHGNKISWIESHYEYKWRYWKIY